jgi:hypothetical protein
MYTVQQPNPNYVVLANWTLSGNDGTNTASIQGSTQFAVQASDPNFVPYASLTQSTVIGWIQSSLGPQGIANFEANVQGQINSIENPPVTPQNTALPWA